MKNKIKVFLIIFVSILGVGTNVSLAGGLSAPNIQKADVGEYGVVLAWESPPGNESGFVVERGTDGTHFTAIAIGMEGKTYNPKVQYFYDAYGWYNLAHNTEYYYRMRVYKASKGGSSQYSPYSNVLKAKTY